MKRKLLFLTLMLALLAMLTMITSADSIEWTITSDMSEIIVNNQPYKLYDVEFDDSILPLPEKMFVYYDVVAGYTLLRSYEESGIMLLKDYDDDYIIYANDDGKAVLDEFFSGKYASYKLYDSFFERICSISNDFVSTLNTGKAINIDVKKLSEYNIYEILGYDKVETMAHKVGAIYYLENKYYYVDYDSLPNNNFDADGNFSYRQGKVSAYIIEAGTISKVRGYADDLNYIQTVYEEDENNMFTGFNKPFYTVIFVAFTAIFGFIIPLVPIAFCAIRLLGKKSKNPKRLILIMSILCLWILLSIGILLALML